MMPKYLYTLLGATLTPGLKLWLERRARRGREDPFRMRERFGHPSAARPSGILIWVHAASVGETQSILMLMRKLLEAHPALHVLITTGTVTSAALIAQQNLARVVHQFVPVDTPAAVRRFLDHWHPDLALWVESEFWPQLLWQSQAQRIPMLLINARISYHAYKGWRRWPRTIKKLLAGFTCIYAGSTSDAERLQALGAREVRTSGNLKYDASALPVDSKLLDAITHMCSGRPIFVAASTHANEEVYVAEAHHIAMQQFPDLLTIIVPRHAARGDAIAADLRERGYSLAQRSKSELVTPNTALYLADTMGELGSFYRLANIVFMGGSLVAHGGQNPLEAARLSCTLITGAYTHNFEGIISQLVAANAIRIVADKHALATTLLDLLAYPSQCKEMASHARSMVEQSRGATAAILQHCTTLIRHLGAP